MYPFILIVPIHLLLISYTSILFLTNRNIDPLSFTTTFIYDVHLPHSTSAPPPPSSICYFLRCNRCRMAIKVYLPVCPLSFSDQGGRD